MSQSNDDLIDAVRRSLRDQADRIHPSDEPFDAGLASARPSLETTPVTVGAWRPSRVLVVLAAAVVLIVAVAGVVVTRDGEDRGVQVVAGPDGGFRHVLPPLAPEGVDWFVSSYTPTDDFGWPPAYAVDFELHGFSWELKVGGSDSYPTDHPVAIGDRMVSIFADDRPPGEVSSASWRDSSGQWVFLGGLGAEPDGSQADAEVVRKPTTAQVAEVVALIQPVPDGEWLAALNPPDGVVDPGFRGSTVPMSSDVTTRPLHLGLDAPSDKTRVLVQPWTVAQSILDVDGFGPATFRLVATSMPLPTTLFLFEDRLGDAVTVRGVKGHVVTTDGAPKGPQEPPDFPGWMGVGVPGYNRSISWAEAGSYVQLQFLDGATVDDALAVADALVVLDDARWTALLFPSPVDEASDPSVTVTTHHLTTSTSSPAPLRTRLELASTTVPAGAEVPGQVVVNNDTGHPIDAVGCGALFGVGLSSDTIDARPMSLGCAQPFVIPAGESTWLVSLRATYSSCANDDTISLIPIPDCLPDRTGMPPLPPGRYTAHVSGPSGGVPTPAPVEVTVT